MEKVETLLVIFLISSMISSRNVIGESSDDV